MSYVIFNARTDEIVSPSFKKYGDAFNYRKNNKNLKWDDQRHYFEIKQVKGREKKSNKSKLKIT